MERGRYDEAEKAFRRAVSLDAKHFPAHYDLGRMLVRLKRYAEALPILEHASTLSATDPGIHYQLFTAYTRLKRKDDAERELALFKKLEEARKKDESSPGGSATSDQPVPPTSQQMSAGPLKEKPE
jgi:tetratricopeptide (TPR) repeat protein